MISNKSNWVDDLSLPYLQRIAFAKSPALVRGALRRLPVDTRVALTFDDGPHPDTTPQALEALQQRNLKATFFMLGERCEQYPEIARRVREAGHHIGSHGYSHFRHIGSKRLVNQSIIQAQHAIASATGERPVYFRPPYGWWRPDMHAILQQQGLHLVLWSLMPGDFLPSISAEDVGATVRETVRGGDIIVLHDGEKQKSTIQETICAVADALDTCNMRTTFLDEQDA